jgi:hypothetical protein
MSNLTAQRVREVLAYNPETGALTWLSARGRQPAGAIAGCDSGQGYRDIRVDGEQHRAHVIAFLHFYGRWPEHEIDHINGRRDDNRIVNLRDVPRSINRRNAARSTNNKSGVTGVFWNTEKGKWTAKIKVNRREIHLGHFTILEEAAAARKAAEQAHGFSPRHGSPPEAA